MGYSWDSVNPGLPSLAWQPLGTWVATGFGYKARSPLGGSETEGQTWFRYRKATSFYLALAASNRFGHVAGKQAGNPMFLLEVTAGALHGDFSGSSIEQSQ